MAEDSINEGIQQIGGGTISNSGVIAIGKGASASGANSGPLTQPQEAQRPNGPMPAGHVTILCADVESFGDPRRDHSHQLIVRKGLYDALEASFAREHIPWEICYHEDRGDGAMVLLPPEIPKRQIADLPARLAAALTLHNHTHRAEAQIRLRLAVHAGEVHRDDHGVAGTALIHAFRLLEAAPLKRGLAENPGVLALILSDWFYTNVIRHSPDCYPAAYEPTEITIKETRTKAWIRTSLGAA